jgi:hypothetical protein
MADQQRPTAVTVIATITLIQGFLGLLHSVGCGLPVGIAFVSSPWDDSPLDFLTAFFFLGFVQAVVQIVVGRGLLRLRRWARMVCMIYAVFCLVLTVGLSIVSIAYEGSGDTILLCLPFILFPLAYCIAVMIVLNLRDVRAAFGHATVGSTDTGAEPGR